MQFLRNDSLENTRFATRDSFYFFAAVCRNSLSLIVPPSSLGGKLAPKPAVSRCWGGGDIDTDTDFSE